MKKYLYIIILMTPFLMSTVSAQERILVQAEGSIIIPNGSFAGRFDPGFSFSLSAGMETSPGWKWFGKVEYITLADVNEDELYVKRNLSVQGVQKTVNVPTPGLEMNFSAVGASAQLENTIIESEFLSVNLQLGFGIYRWESLRGSFRDSIYYDTTGSGSPSGIEFISIAEIKQLDWSGGFNFGAGVVVPVIKPVDFYLAANYRAIIGELWPALVLNKENISVFQMFDIRVGFRGQF